MNISVFGCTDIRIARHNAEAGNCIGLKLETDTGAVDISLFGLPERLTNKLLAVLADDKTRYSKVTTGGTA